MFRFKQFEIKQDKTAMKVGTDGVLLGAWTNTPSGSTALDIGSGTGLISIMLAQRSPLNIEAVELDNSAYLQSLENIENSPWSSRISCTNSSIQNFTAEKKYDLIVSNPPFFENSFKTDVKERNLARHTDSLSFADLIKSIKSLLSDNGIASVIIPFASENNFISTAEAFGLYPSRVCRVKGHEKSPVKRSLIELKHSKSNCEISDLTIEISRHIYTKEYINLTKDFYLKM